MIPNYKEKIKAVFFDIDETLFVKEKEYLPDSAFLAIQKLQQAGVTVGIATGRVRHSFPQKLNDAISKLNINTFVTANGQYVELNGKVLEKHPIPTEKLQKLVDFFDSLNVDYAQVANHEIFVSKASDILINAFNPITTDYGIDRDYFKTNDVLQFLPFYNESLDELVNKANILDGLKTVRWHADSVDIFDADGSKARGIQSVVNHLGLTMDNVMAFGDGLNDLEMLSLVGVGVAMGNAHDELKNVATHVTDHVENDGVYNFLVKAQLID